MTKREKRIALVELIPGPILMFMTIFVGTGTWILFIKLRDVIYIFGLGALLVGIVTGIYYLEQKQKFMASSKAISAQPC